MPKGVEGQQLANSGTAQNLSNQLTANSANIYGGLEPTLAAQAAHPSGYTPAQTASMDTAAQQSAGGSTAGAVGQGGLYAARTRNAGAGQAAIGASDRAAGSNLSNAAVGVQNKSANLAQGNQRAALGGLEHVMGTEQSGGEEALGLSNQALQGASSSSANNPVNQYGQILLKALLNNSKASSDGLSYGGGG